MAYFISLDLETLKKCKFSKTMCHKRFYTASRFFWLTVTAKAGVIVARQGFVPETYCLNLLTVLFTDVNMTCNSDIGDKYSDDENLSVEEHQDTVTITCAIIYRGNQSPFVQWSIVKVGSILDGLSLQGNADSTIINYGTYNILTSKLTLSVSKRLDSSSVKCQLSGYEDVSSDFSQVSNIIWTSEKISTKCSGNRHNNSFSIIL